MPQETTIENPTAFKVPGFPSKSFIWLDEVIGDVELQAVVIDSLQPDRLESLLRADGRFSERFFRAYRSNLKRDASFRDLPNQ
jgi:hypothetical protein